MAAMQNWSEATPQECAAWCHDHDLYLGSLQEPATPGRWQAFVHERTSSDPLFASAYHIPTEIMAMRMVCAAAEVAVQHRTGHNAGNESVTVGAAFCNVHRRSMILREVSGHPGKTVEVCPECAARRGCIMGNLFQPPSK